METASKITDDQIKAGHRLSPEELRQASNWFKDHYIEIVSRQLVGLRTDDLTYITVSQEKAYRSIRMLCFARKIETYKTAEIFYQLTDLDQRICVQCMASLGEQLPAFLKKNKQNRYWYNFWYAQANREQITSRTKTWRDSLPEDSKVKRRKNRMKSTRNYLQTEKGRARSQEYMKNYYRRKQAEAGKSVRPFKSRKCRTKTAGKGLWARIMIALKYVVHLLFDYRN